METLLTMDTETVEETVSSRSTERSIPKKGADFFLQKMSCGTIDEEVVDDAVVGWRDIFVNDFCHCDWDADGASVNTKDDTMTMDETFDETTDDTMEDTNESTVTKERIMSRNKKFFRRGVTIDTTDEIRF